MTIGGIDKSRIDAMLVQLRAAAAKMEGGVEGIAGIPTTPIGGLGGSKKLDFAEALKSSLDQVNAMQGAAQQQGQKFALGDDSVGLSDVMISMQKANIAFQMTVQVRNKLVSAYHDIMNMQI